MRVDISKLTSAMNKVSIFTSDMKIVPGVLLDMSDGLLKICFSDNHKALIEKISMEKEEGDLDGKIVVGYEQLSRAVANCQPSGSIKISNARFSFHENNIMKLSVDQVLEVTDADGNVVDTKKMASRKMDIAYTAPDADMKVAILSRTDYESIFETKKSEDTAIEPDIYDKKEFIDALNKTSSEKGRQIYISARTQNVFVSNQAHLTAVPISGYEVTEEEKDEIRAELSENNMYSEENLKAEIGKKANRVHYSITMSQAMAKSIADILSKTSADYVSVYTDNKFCNIFINTETEVVGIWFEMVLASKAHIGAFERYNSLNYDTYQLTFFREFLADMIKSALNVTKSDKTEVKFVPTTTDGATTALDMVIGAGSSASSVSDVYSINPENIVGDIDGLKGTTLKIALKVVNDMLSQIKTLRVGFDIDIREDGTTCMRISEIDTEQLNSAYARAREATRIQCEQSGISFDPNSTPTPDEIKKQYLRSDAVMKTRQYTILAV